MDQVQKVAAHALIQNSEGKYLVTRRSQKNDWKPGEYDIPGGTIEFGENPIEALKREVLEEVGLEIKVNEPVYVFSYLSSPERHQFQIVYKCEYLEGDVKLNPEEHDEYQFLNNEEISKLPLIAFLKSLSDNYLNKNNG